MDRQDLCDLVKAVKDDTSEIRIALFGPKGQPQLGFVARTEERLDIYSKRLRTVEHRVWGWAGAFGIIALLLALIASYGPAHIR